MGVLPLPVQGQRHRAVARHHRRRDVRHRRYRSGHPAAAGRDARRSHRKDGTKQSVPVLCRIDTPIEVDYYRTAASCRSCCASSSPDQSAGRSAPRPLRHATGLPLPLHRSAKLAIICGSLRDERLPRRHRSTPRTIRLRTIAPLRPRRRPHARRRGPSSQRTADKPKAEPAKAADAAREAATTVAAAKEPRQGRRRATKEAAKDAAAARRDRAAASHGGCRQVRRRDEGSRRQGRRRRQGSRRAKEVTRSHDAGTAAGHPPAVCSRRSRTAPQPDVGAACRAIQRVSGFHCSQSCSPRERGRSNTVAPSRAQWTYTCVSRRWRPAGNRTLRGIRRARPRCACARRRASRRCRSRARLLHRLVVRDRRRKCAVAAMSNADGVSGTSITSAWCTASRSSSPCSPAGVSTTLQIGLLALLGRRRRSRSAGNSGGPPREPFGRRALRIVVASATRWRLPASHPRRWSRPSSCRCRPWDWRRESSACGSLCVPSVAEGVMVRPRATATATGLVATRAR